MDKRIITSYRLGHDLERDIKKVVPSIYQSKAEFFRAALINVIIFENKDILDIISYDVFNISGSITCMTVEYTPRLDRLFRGYYFRMIKKHPELEKFPTKSEIFRMCCWELLNRIQKSRRD